MQLVRMFRMLMAFSGTALVLGGPVSENDELALTHAKRIEAENTIPGLEVISWDAYKRTVSSLESRAVKRQLLGNPGGQWECPNEKGPDPIQCPPVIGRWKEYAQLTTPHLGGKIAIPGKSCLSLREKSCWSLLCAPQPMGAVVDVSLVMGRLMKPCLVFCAVNGREGLWQDRESGSESLRIELRRNPLEEKPEEKPEDEGSVGNATQAKGKQKA